MTMTLPKAEVADDFGITWYVLPPGGPLRRDLDPDLQSGKWIDAGMTRDRLYVTYKPPLSNVPKLFETVVRPRGRKRRSGRLRTTRSLRAR